ncbi:hypothetical protein [Alkalihalobacterium bogoriense]|uniref:hypothetical protein n=1 Tax=Alkalihalobacterium bogoriense TaxID=246272 RepID=UPI00047DF7A3|nr:hypothetical protein [Alkalihalobacterium bogoriense]
MDEKLEQLKEAMDSTTHKGKHFTNQQKANIRYRVKTEVPTKNKQPFFVTYGFGAIVALLVVILVIPDFVSNDDNQTANQIHLQNIDMTLLAESMSNDNRTFRRDIAPSRLGIVQIDDKQWNRFVAKAFTYDEKVDLNLHLQEKSDYDIVVVMGEEKHEMKTWVVNNQVYYTNFPNTELFVLEEKHSAYFIRVMNHINF